MANSTTNLDLISASQASKEVTANALFDANSPTMIFGRRASTTTALTWGYYGGYLLVDGTRTAIANGTVALTASATNYVESSRAGVVSKNTTGFTAGSIPLYVVVTGASSVTSYTDERVWADQKHLTSKASVTLTTADVTLLPQQARSEYLTASGTLTGNRAIIVPNDWKGIVFNNCAGAFTLTVKTSAGGGIVVDAATRASLYADGTDVQLVSSSASSYSLPTATDLVKGGIKVGDGLAIDAEVLSVSQLVNSQTGTTYTYLATDNHKLVTHANGSAIAATLPQAGTTGFEAGYAFDVINIGAGDLTITPATSTIDGSASATITTGQGIRIVSDGTNYFSVRGAGGYTLPEASAGTLGGIKVGSGLSITSGVLSATAGAPNSRSITDFGNNTATTTGLTYGYLAGVIRSDNVVTEFSAGTISLTASDTNYVEVNDAGTVSVNLVGFTTGRYPMAEVITDGSGITTLNDMRGIINLSTIYTDEMARDAIGTALTVSGNLSKTIDDGADTITIATAFDKAEVYRNAAVNTTTAGIQKISMDTVVFDTNSIWNAANSRFIPKKAGYYMVNFRIRTNTAQNLVAYIGVNGSAVRALGADAGTVSFAAGGSGLVYCNGTTDYVEPFIFTTSARAVTTGTLDTNFSIVGPF